MNNNTKFNYYVEEIINHIYKERLLKASYKLGISRKNL